MINRLLCILIIVISICLFALAASEGEGDSFLSGGMAAICTLLALVILYREKKP